MESMQWVLLLLIIGLLGVVLGIATQVKRAAKERSKIQALLTEIADRLDK